MIGTNGKMTAGAMNYIWSQEVAEEKAFRGNGKMGEPRLGSFLRRRRCPERRSCFPKRERAPHHGFRPDQKKQ
jgi:hypothetical protein